MKSFLIFISVLVPAVVWAGTIQVVTDTGPYAYIEEGEPKGMFMALAEALMAEADIKEFRLDIMPWSRAYKLALNVENTMILPLARTLEREGRFKWVGPIMPIRFYFIRLKDSEHIKVHSLESAKKYSIGVILADVSHNYLLNNQFLSLSPAGSPKLLIRMLNKKRVDMICITRNKLAYTSGKQGIDLSVYTFEWHLKDLDLDIYAGFNKQTDNGIVRAVQQGLLDIKAKGIYQRIMEPVLIPAKNATPSLPE